MILKGCGHNWDCLRTSLEGHEGTCATRGNAKVIREAG